MVKNCLVCHNPLYTKPSAVKNGRGKYCSRKCYDLYRNNSYSERFWKWVDKTDGCWIWKGVRPDERYGVFRYRDENWYTHRFSWFLTYGYFPKQYILHKCDNPPCVRPDHLFEGTAKENTQDAIKKGRVPQIGRNNFKNLIAPMRKLTLEQANEIRRKYELGKVTMKQLGISYKVHESSIHLIINNKTYRR